MLVRYEFLKILRKKSSLIVMAVSLILTGFLFGLPIMQYQTYNQDGAIKGADGIAYEKGRYADLSVPLSEEYVAKTIREVQELFENPDNIGYRPCLTTRPGHYPMNKKNIGAVWRTRWTHRYNMDTMRDGKLLSAVLSF